MKFTLLSLALLIMTTIPAPLSHGKIVIERVEATINANSILLSDVTNFRKTLNLRKQLDPLFNGTPLASKSHKATDKEIIDFLLDEKIIIQQFPVADELVEKEINSIQANNNINRRSLIAALKEQGFLFKNYFELIRPSIAKRNLIDRDIRTKVHISDDDIKNYFYSTYKKPNQQNLSYMIGIITLSTDTHGTLPEAKKAALKTAELIKAGQSFEDAAKKFSDDANAKNGGGLGFLRFDKMSPLIKKAMKKLKVGKISKPILAGKNAYIILKLKDIKSGDKDELKSVSKNIRMKLTSEEYTRQVKLWLERQRQNAFIHYAGEPSLPNKNAK